MAESLILDRIKFRKRGVQARFILESKETAAMSWKAFAKELKINPRTLYGWAKEKFHMPHVTAKIISKLTTISIPEGFTVIKWDNHMKQISNSGGRSLINKYGKVPVREEIRKEKWKEWWEKSGKYKEKTEGFQSVIKIKTPRKNVLLAEFIGIMLGDGGINKYYTTVTLSNKEKPYIFFVSKMISKLFGVKPKIYKLKNAEAVKVTVNRKQLVNFCKKIGLVEGNKVNHQVDIPKWIKKNKTYTKACVRGLIDTDGCFYINSYYSNHRKYSYFKLAYTSASLPLIKSVAEILKNLGIKARISKNYKDVRIEERYHVSKYVKEIGSHNNKHLQKIKKWKKDRNMLE